MNHLKSFLAQKDLITKIGNEGSAHLIWAMGLYLDESDLDTLASSSLIDKNDGKGDDKKIDFIHIDRDAGHVVFAQGYYSLNTKKDSAPANKASDLNTAAAWLFSGDINLISENLRPAILESRSAINDGDIDTIELLYVHNRSESVNVTRELQTAAAHLRKTLGDDTTINIIAKELGLETLERLFLTEESDIEVLDEIACPSKIEFEETGPNWRAGVLSVPGNWLHTLYQKYGDNLFSANYRGFLGISKKKKINTGIRQSAESKAQDFWVFNNGVTILTLGMESSGKDETKLKGISIINGAQTTGSIGSIDLVKYNLQNLRVLGRIIECSDRDTIGDIVRFNNTQNEIKSWDMYSNTAEQSRIAKEFEDLGHVYSMKRKFRKPETGQIVVGIEDVVQPLLAFHGSFNDANRGKNTVFDRKPLYKLSFEDRKARHILLIFTLAKAIDERRFILKQKHTGGIIMSIEENQLSKLRHLKFKYFFMSIVSKCLESVLGKKVDTDLIAFTPKVANRENYSILELTAAWGPVVDTLLTYVCTQMGDNVSEELTNEDKAETVSKTVSAMIYASRSTLPFDNFSTLVSTTG